MYVKGNCVTIKTGEREQEPLRRFGFPDVSLSRLFGRQGLFVSVGFVCQLSLKLCDPVLELLDLDLLALVFTGQPFDDLASVGHLHASFPPVRIQRGCPGCDYMILYRAL